MTTCRVIALDPGGYTGWAAATWTEMPIISEGPIERLDFKLTCGYLGPDEHHDELYSHLERQRVQKYSVVSESFEYRLHDKKDRIKVVLVSKEYIGVAKLFCVRELDKELVQFNAGQSKPFTTDAALRKLGLWIPGKPGKDMMDAYRVLFFYLTRQGLLPEELLRKGWKE